MKIFLPVALNKSLVVLLVMLAALTGNAQVSIDSITARLEKHQAAFPQEKIYLHMDRPYYSVGDTLWFKAYVVDALENKPDTISKNIYVDFFKKDNGKQVYTAIVKNMGGYASGYFPLADSLPEGAYEIRSYTHWMRNFGEVHFFKKEVYLRQYPTKPLSDTDKISKKEIADVQFFPEGGNLVAGLKSRIAFKAVNKYGKGVDFKAFIISEKTKVPIATIQSKHLGMGTFVFTPKAGERYFVKIENTDQTKLPRLFELPQVMAEGYTFFIDNLSSKELIKVIAQNNYPVKDRPIIIAHQRGKVIFTSQNPTEGNSFLWSFKKTDIPDDGIVHFTLFKKTGEPQCERLIYNDTKKSVQVSITPNKKEYKPNEKVELQITVKDGDGEPLQGNFSLAVTDTHQVHPDKDGMNISNYLNLISDVSSLSTGELKGTIEQPGHYFDSTDPNAIVDLDILLMTQGWRRFIWQQIMEKREAATYSIESGISLQGTALKTNGKPAGKPVEISLVYHTDKGATEILMTDTNTEGKFIFPSLDLTGESSVMIQGVKEKGGRDLLLQLDKPKLTEYIPTENVDPFNGIDSTADDRAQKRYLDMKAKLAMSKTKVLNEVTVTAKVIKDDRRQLYSGVPVRKMAVTSDNCYTVSSILQMLQGRFAGVTVFPTTEGGVGGYDVTMRGHNSFLGDLPPAYLLDGFIVSLDVIGNVRPCAVESIEVSTSVFPALNRNGIISVLTKHGNPNFAAVYPDEPIPGRIMARIKGYQAAREFYSPKYIDSTPNKKEFADIRATVYWNPLIKTDADGNAKVTFWNTDEHGTVHLNLQGVSIEGTPISVTSEYKVE